MYDGYGKSVDVVFTTTMHCSAVCVAGAISCTYTAMRAIRASLARSRAHAPEEQDVGLWPVNCVVVPPLGLLNSQASPLQLHLSNDVLLFLRPCQLHVSFCIKESAVETLCRRLRCIECRVSTASTACTGQATTHQSRTSDSRRIGLGRRCACSMVKLTCLHTYPAVTMLADGRFIFFLRRTHGRHTHRYSK